MVHLSKDNALLRGRLNRLIGQLEGIRTMLDEAPHKDEEVCYRIMQQVAAARGAMNGLMRQLVAAHLNEHVLSGKTPKARRKGCEEILKVLRSFGS